MPCTVTKLSLLRHAASVAKMAQLACQSTEQLFGQASTKGIAIPSTSKTASLLSHVPEKSRAKSGHLASRSAHSSKRGIPASEPNRSSPVQSVPAAKRTSAFHAATVPRGARQAQREAMMPHAVLQQKEAVRARSHVRHRVVIPPDSSVENNFLEVGARESCAA